MAHGAGGMRCRQDIRFSCLKYSNVIIILVDEQSRINFMSKHHVHLPRPATQEIRRRWIPELQERSRCFLAHDDHVGEVCWGGRFSVVIFAIVAVVLAENSTLWKN